MTPSNRASIISETKSGLYKAENKCVREVFSKGTDIMIKRM